MNDAIAETYLEIRLLVGYLGEKAQNNWWASSFYEPTAMQFLTPVFARTARLAQYNGVREAARRVHDQSVGIGQVFHLFRLPEEIEQDLHRRAEKLNDGSAPIANLANTTTAMLRLDALANGEGGKSDGPVSLGALGDLQKPVVLKRLAAHYVRAFKSGTHSFPYFTG